jgi:hypothetical protein
MMSIRTRETEDEHGTQLNSQAGKSVSRDEAYGHELKLEERIS